LGGFIVEKCRESADDSAKSFRVIDRCRLDHHAESGAFDLRWLSTIDEPA
jgi:hypothetical protein